MRRIRLPKTKRCVVKAIVMHERGAADVLRYESFLMPRPGPSKVLVRVPTVYALWEPTL